MSVDNAFLGAGQEVGLETWRIEKLKVVKQDPSTHGEFYSGDSYIILHTSRQGNSPKLEWDLHFWLGKNTSQDEAGISAYKTVELDDSLGGGPVQYREVQDHESRKFLSYFKTGIKYLEGGVESGFRKVPRGQYVKRLFLIKGKRNVRVTQVELTYKSLNQGDVFILDDGLTIYVWIGPKSSKMERIKGTEVAKQIKDEERGGKAKIVFVDDQWNGNEHFFTALGDRGEIRDDEEAGDDKEHETSHHTQVSLYRVTDESGSIEMNVIDETPLKREHLESKDCFILDCGTSGIFVWIGKNCTKNEKIHAMDRATEFLSMKGYPSWTLVMRVVEGGETPIFKQFFQGWTNTAAQVGLGKVYRKERVADYSNEKFDSTNLHKQKKTKKDNLPDDGEGKVEIWRVTNKDLVPVPDEMYGTFYTGDSYVLLYTYKKNRRENYIIYFWQGSKSTTDERGASAIFAQQMDDKFGGSPMQIRVVQGGEPEHFLRIFQGKMVALLGGVGNKEPDSDVKIFQVRGTNSYNTRAAQVLPRASSFNSNDVFIIVAKDKTYVWNGKGASPDEKEVAKKLLTTLSPPGNLANVVCVDEDSESQDFWQAIGGQEPYAKGERLQTNAYDMPPRLFQCSNASGRFDVEEIVDFSQEDLIEDDVMILDTIDEVYVWLGKGANEIEKKMSLQTAMEYIEHDPTGRSVANVVILSIKQGFEPPAFTGHFLGWDPDKWSAGKTYEDLKRELGDESVQATTVQEELASYDSKYPYEELIKPTPPKGVHISWKEKHLTDEEFLRVFKMTVDDFYKMPGWKQVNLKKKAGLF